MWWSSQILTAIANLKAVVINGFALINKRLDAIVVAQVDIDNAVAVVTGLLTDLGADSATVLTDLTDIQTKLANGTPVDVTALNSTIGQVSAIQASLKSAVTSLDTLATAA